MLKFFKNCINIYRHCVVFSFQGNSNPNYDTLYIYIYIYIGYLGVGWHPILTIFKPFDFGTNTFCQS
jgi:hypothetical protein